MASQDWLDKDFYAVLGVGKDADEGEIKKAYRKLAKQYHPDRNAGDAAAEQKFKDVGEAHAVLSDPEQLGRPRTAPAVAERLDLLAEVVTNSSEVPGPAVAAVVVAAVAAPAVPASVPIPWCSTSSAATSPRQLRTASSIRSSAVSPR